MESSENVPTPDDAALLSSEPVYGSMEDLPTLERNEEETNATELVEKIGKTITQGYSFYINDLILTTLCRSSC
jgi:hypothetical protein